MKKKYEAVDLSRGNSSVGRAPDPHSGGQGFNSPLLHIFLHRSFAFLSAAAIAIVAARGSYPLGDGGEGSSIILNNNNGNKIGEEDLSAGAACFAEAQGQVAVAIPRDVGNRQRGRVRVERF